MVFPGVKLQCKDNITQMVPQLASLLFLLDNIIQSFLARDHDHSLLFLVINNCAVRLYTRKLVSDQVYALINKKVLYHVF